jgi:RimJ/RimL family protein N-acetyltransferase
MHVETKNVTLVPHVPADLLALMESNAAYEKSSGMRIAHGVREFLLAGSPDFRAQLKAATEPDPWKFGFATIHKIDNVVIGTCGFAGPPDSDGVVEIAYSIAPDYEGRGYATEAAGALVEFASQNSCVRTISAYTLREINASTRVLEKCGFRKTGELIDSENNPVWRWEKLVSSRTE